MASDIIGRLMVVGAPFRESACELARDLGESGQLTGMLVVRSSIVMFPATATARVAVRVQLRRREQKAVDDECDHHLIRRRPTMAFEAVLLDPSGVTLGRELGVVCGGRPVPLSLERLLSGDHRFENRGGLAIAENVDRVVVQVHRGVSDVKTTVVVVVIISCAPVKSGIG